MENKDNVLDLQKMLEEKFEEMKRQLNAAEKYIFLEYFIVERGKMWDEILEILIDKVKQGVEVRFMYDGMCSLFQLPYHYDREIRKYGIQCKMFSPIRPILSSYQNNRDHRKICVIDGRVGFTGGINLADEYINAKERFGYWKDTAVMLEGEAVQNLTMLFLQMWNVADKKAEYGKYLQTEDLRNLVKEYNARLVNMHQRVKVLDPKEPFEGNAQGIKEEKYKKYIFQSIHINHLLLIITKLVIK